MKSKIIRRLAGILAFLMLATQISIPVYAEDAGVADDFEVSTTSTGTEGCIEEGESFLDAPLGSPYYSGEDEVMICCEGLEKKHTYDKYSLPDKCILNKGPRYICIKCGDGTCGRGENKCNCPEDCQDTTQTEGVSFTSVGLSEDVDETNVVEVVSGDVEDAVEEAVEDLIDQAVEEVLESLEGESTDEVADALDDLEEDLQEEIDNLQAEVQDNPNLRLKIMKRIEHLKNLLIKLRVKLIYQNQSLIQRVVRIKNVPAIYEIRWGDLLGIRQPCRLVPLRELKEALSTNILPVKCEINKVEYTGKISVDKGELKIHKKVLFEENDEVVTDSGSAIGFNSIIAGHWDGLVVQYIPPTDDTEVKSAVNVTVSIGDLDETYVGNEVLGRKKIGNGHMIEFRHLGKILPGLVKATENNLIQNKLKIQDKIANLRNRLDRIRLMKNAGTGADELDEVLDEASEYNFDDETAADVQVEISAVLDGLSDNSDPDEIKAKAKMLKAKIIALKQQAKGLKFKNHMIPFMDTDDDQWYTGYVSAVKNRGIISGYKDVAGNELGEFRPANNITVAEILKIALETAGKGKASGTPGLRSALNHWAKEYVKKAEELGVDLVESDVDLNRPATRGEVVRLMLEALDIDPDAITSTDFSDVPRLHKHALFIQYAKELGIVSGDDNTGNFRPDAPINRAEAAKIADQILSIIIGGWDSVTE